MSDTEGKVRIGTSGYVYDHWRGVFYPEDLPKKQWFEHYCTRFDTVEINNTFYHLPQAETFDRWRERASHHFCYVLKFSNNDAEGFAVQNALTLQEYVGSD